MQLSSSDIPAILIDPWYNAATFPQNAYVGIGPYSLGDGKMNDWLNVDGSVNLRAVNINDYPTAGLGESIRLIMSNQDKRLYGSDYEGDYYKITRKNTQELDDFEPVGASPG